MNRKGSGFSTSIKWKSLRLDTGIQLQKNLNEFLWFEEPKKQSATQAQKNRILKTKLKHFRYKRVKNDGYDSNQQINKESDQRRTLQFSVLHYIFKSRENGNKFRKREEKPPPKDVFRQKLRFFISRVV